MNLHSHHGPIMVTWAHNTDTPFHNAIILSKIFTLHKVKLHNT